VTTAIMSNVMLAVSAVTVLPSSIVAPTWLCENQPFPASEMLACKKLSGSLAVFVEKKPTITISPQTFSGEPLDYEFDPNAPSQRNGSPSRAVGRRIRPPSTHWQEWFGYCMLPDHEPAEDLMLVGPKR